MKEIKPLKPLFDEYGIIHQAMDILPDDKLKLCFLEALAELEDNECHSKRRVGRSFAATHHSI